MTFPPIPFTHPFPVGTRIRDLRDRRESTVTELTQRGFKYEYDTPQPFGRAAWGQQMTGGEVYLDMPESSHWRFEAVDTSPDFSDSP